MTLAPQIIDTLERIDTVIKSNRTTVRIVTAMSIAIFAVGITLLLLGFESGDWMVLTPSALITGLIYWPVNKILAIRKETMHLAVVPALVTALPPEQAAEEIIKLIETMKP